MVSATRLAPETTSIGESLNSATPRWGPPLKDDHDAFFIRAGTPTETYYLAVHRVGAGRYFKLLVC
jgi:hypothetical protein